MNKAELNRIVQKLLHRSGSTVRVALESYFPGGRLVGGKYVMSSHTVTMYTEVIRQQCLQLFGSLEQVYAYFAVVFAHELGHAADHTLQELCSRMDAAENELVYMRIALQAEENAWNNAAEWISDIHPSLVRVIVDQSLAAYHAEIESTEIASTEIA